MVHLDDLDRIKKGRRGLGQVHHQHCADGEVRCHDATNVLGVAGGLELVDIRGRQAGRPDDRRCARGHGRQRVVHGLGGSREVNQRPRPLLMQERGEVVAAPDAPDIIDAGFDLKRGSENRTDFAFIAGNRNPDGTGLLPTSWGGHRRSRWVGSSEPAATAVGLVPAGPPVASAAVASAAVPTAKSTLARRGRR